MANIAMGWTAFSVDAAARGLGDVINGTVTTEDEVKVTITSLGNFGWIIFWFLVYW